METFYVVKIEWWSGEDAGSHHLTESWKLGCSGRTTGSLDREADSKL